MMPHYEWHCRQPIACVISILAEALEQKSKSCKHLIHVLDADTLLIDIILQDELLQVEERPLVPCVLPHL